MLPPPEVLQARQILPAAVRYDPEATAAVAGLIAERNSLQQQLTEAHVVAGDPAMMTMLTIPLTE